jgi:hypothetical protein
MFTAFILGLATAAILCLFLDTRNITGHHVIAVLSARAPLRMAQLENRHKGFSCNFILGNFVSICRAIQIFGLDNS